MKFNNNIAGKSIWFASVLAGTLALSISTFNARAEDTGGAATNDRKKEANSSGQYECKCNTSGSGCRCMVS